MFISNLHVKRFPQPCVQATVNPKNTKIVQWQNYSIKLPTLNQGKIAHEVLYVDTLMPVMISQQLSFLLAGVIYENYLLGRKRALWYVYIIAFA